MYFNSNIWVHVQVLKTVDILEYIGDVVISMSHSPSKQLSNTSFPIVTSRVSIDLGRLLTHSRDGSSRKVTMSRPRSTRSIRSDRHESNDWLTPTLMFHQNSVIYKPIKPSVVNYCLWYYCPSSILNVN